MIKFIAGCTCVYRAKSSCVLVLQAHGANRGAAKDASYLRGEKRSSVVTYIYTRTFLQRKTPLMPGYNTISRGTPLTCCVGPAVQPSASAGAHPCRRWHGNGIWQGKGDGICVAVAGVCFSKNISLQKPSLCSQAMRVGKKLPEV